MRLIDVEALMQEMKDEVYIQVDDFEIIAKVIRSAPTIEAKPVIHSHWEKYDDSKCCYCSHCGKPAAEDDDVSWHGYCPICGAQMDEKEG